MLVMKRIPKTLAPGQRLTLWVPTLASLVLGGLWLGLTLLI